MKATALLLLEQGLAELASARLHLDYSFNQVVGLPETLPSPTEAQLESAEKRIELRDGQT